VRSFRDEVCRSGNLDPLKADAQSLLDAAASLKGVKLTGLPADHEWLRGTLARTDRGRILFNSEIEKWVTFYNQAHEFGHIVLAHGERDCVASDLDYEAAEARIPFGVHRVEGYSPHERIESEANIFAREFLLSCDVVRELFIQHGQNAEQIASSTGMGIEMVSHQLAYAILTPTITAANLSQKSETELTLDKFQQEAAEVPEGPQLIDAGPGTGKTRTLVGRVLYLLKEGISPENILILTFSNKAADELRSRVYDFAPQQAGAITIETFHSFGLELLRKYGSKLGLPAKLEIVDPVDALFAMEKALPDLRLDHYENLYEPALYLGNILKAVSRAKDEHAGPERYRELGEAQLSAAADEKQQLAAEKVLEVAGVYEYYRDYLTSGKLLDLSDLICRSIDLLRDHEKVQQEVRGLYRHVLVDEYQDVNRASGLMLRELVGDGRGLWVVGDLRQSIHRWRGATTANIRQFNDDFPLAKPVLTLGKNYRSKPGIVQTFGSFVPDMKATAGQPFTMWETERGDDEVQVKLETASDLDAEAVGIAREVERLNKECGMPYRDQAIICRSHTNLARIARILEIENVPILYLGDFFERPEIRDMLALLSLACEPDGRGLVRVARFPEYDIPLEDVRTLHRVARESSTPFPRALPLAADIPDLPEEAKRKFLLINEHLNELTHGRSAWKTLTRYLFARSQYLSPLIADESVAGQQRRLAIYQLLQFVHSQLGRKDPEQSEPKRALLSYIRRLEIYGDEKILRQSNEWADEIDAVRVLTIHASKGLEFRAVFLPVLAKTYMPVDRTYEICPPPLGLIPEGIAKWQREEEECLFFVAMSRARDYLCISRAMRYLNTNRDPSEFFSTIESRSSFGNGGAGRWTESPTEAVPSRLKMPSYEGPEIFDTRLLDLYLKCPRKFFYEFVLGLSGKREDTAYVQFHKCVYDTIRWAQNRKKDGLPFTADEALNELDKFWLTKGPHKHFLAGKYKVSAVVMVSNAIEQLSATDNLLLDEIEVSRPNGSIRFSYDHAEIMSADNSQPGQLLIRRFRTGRPTSKEKEHPIYGLLVKSAETVLPAASVRVQISYLGHGIATDVTLSQKQVDGRLQKYDDAMLGIVNGQFAPTPADHKCHRCPHFFICPAAEETLS
jgi:DNA helicase-2/ATP-dependent DNA helicase PcrA